MFEHQLNESYGIDCQYALYCDVLSWEHTYAIMARFNHQAVEAVGFGLLSDRSRAFRHVKYFRLHRLVPKH